MLRKSILFTLAAAVLSIPGGDASAGGRPPDRGFQNHGKPNDQGFQFNYLGGHSPATAAKIKPNYVRPRYPYPGTDARRR